jgi:tRNA(Ile)-lysidine synthase TilS/MesJ
MTLNMPQLYYSKLMRAIVEFDMIQDGDHILLGISGGKDSIFLAYAMTILKQRLNKDFQLSALTINPQFKDEQGRPALFDIERAREFMAQLDIPYDIIDVDIAGTIAATPDKNPCYTCAFFRRGAINRYAMEHGVNKIAYAHHHDDAVETFLMGLLYSGQLHTFTPVTYLDRTQLTVIRPLVYFREKEIRKAIKIHGFDPVKSPCPHDGHTVRQEIKELIAKLEPQIPDLYEHLGSAMRQGALKELWPAAKSREEMRQTYFAYKNK